MRLLAPAVATALSLVAVPALAQPEAILTPAQKATFLEVKRVRVIVVENWTGTEARMGAELKPIVEAMVRAAGWEAAEGRPNPAPADRSEATLQVELTGRLTEEPVVGDQGIQPSDAPPEAERPRRAISVTCAGVVRLRSSRSELTAALSGTAYGQYDDDEGTAPHARLTLRSAIKSGLLESMAPTFGQLRRMPASQVLAPLLSHEKADVREAAARVIGWTREPAAVELLIGVLGDTSQEARRTAAAQLGEIGDRRAVEPLRALLRRSPTGEDGAEAARALARMGAVEAAPDLLEPLADEETGPAFRNLAIEAFRKSGAAGLDSLLAGAVDPRPRLRREASFLIRVTFLNNEASSERDPAERDRILRRFVAAVGSSDPRVRALAVEGIGWYGDARSAPGLRKLAESDPDPAVRETAQEAAERAAGRPAPEPAPAPAPVTGAD